MWTKWDESYEKSVPFDNGFEKIVQARYPGVEFTQLKGWNFPLTGESEDVDIQIVLTPELFMGTLKGDGHVDVVAQKVGLSSVERLYVVSDVSSPHKFIVHKEIYTSPTDSQNWGVAGIFDNEIVFRYDNSEDVGFATFFVVLAALVLGAIGSVILYDMQAPAPRVKKINNNEKQPSP